MEVVERTSDALVKVRIASINASLLNTPSGDPERLCGGPPAALVPVTTFSVEIIEVLAEPD